MDIKSKASILVTASLSAIETVAAVLRVSGFEAAILDAAQAEAVKDATGLSFVSRSVVMADDGSATVELVYEQATSGSAPDANQGSQQAVQDSASPPVLPPGLQIPGTTPAIA